MAARSSDPCKMLRDDLIAALTKLREGDFSARMPMRGRDPRDREIAELFNEAVGFNDSISNEFARLAKVVGKEGEIASHAWVDVWAGREQGWLSIDVTHRAPANGRHCRLAVGRDYLDACPVRGVRRGGGAEEMQVAVSVGASAQQQQ